RHRCARVDDLHHSGILIGNSPTNAAANSLFNTLIRDGGIFRMAVKNDPNLLSRQSILRQAIQVKRRLSQRRKLRCDDQVESGRVSDDRHVALIDAGSAIHDDKLVLRPKELQRVLNVFHEKVAKELKLVGGLQHVKTAGMLDQDTLQQLGVKPAGAFDK